MKPLRVGSLCSGYGGLEMALAEVLDIELSWVADPDPGATAILAHHHPDVPNLGDITKTNWEGAARIDLLCGGYPCQPFSDAGLRKGVEDERHLWPHFVPAIRVLRPRYVVLENVRGHLRRGFDVVLGDLAALGFDAEWCTIRASEVGAPHGRPRLIVLATAQDADRPARDQRRIAAPGQAPGGRPWANSCRRGGTPVADAYGEHEWPITAGSRRGEPQAPAGGRRAPTTNPAGDGRHQGRPEPEGISGRPDAALSGHAAPADPEGERHGNTRPAGVGGIPATTIASAPIEWGDYEPAIRRWECLSGRPVPRPTEPGRTGERLSPAFVEWMQGIPPGWVTAVPGLTRNQMLKALGNGVVPQQAAAALRLLLPAVLDAQRAPAA